MVELQPRVELASPITIASITCNVPAKRQGTGRGRLDCNLSATLRNGQSALLAMALCSQPLVSLSVWI